MADMGAALTAADKHVVTGGNQPLDWANSDRRDGIAAVRAFKPSDGPDLLIQGSSTLYPPLLAVGLLDELVLMTFPLVLGTGKAPVRTRHVADQRSSRTRHQPTRARAPASDAGRGLVTSATCSQVARVC